MALLITGEGTENSFFFPTGMVVCETIHELDDIHHASQELLVTELENVCDKLKHSDPTLVGYYSGFKQEHGQAGVNQHIVKLTIPACPSVSMKHITAVPAQYSPKPSYKDSSKSIMQCGAKMDCGSHSVLKALGKCPAAETEEKNDTGLDKVIKSEPMYVNDRDLVAETKLMRVVIKDDPDGAMSVNHVESTVDPNVLQIKDGPRNTVKHDLETNGLALLSEFASERKAEIGSSGTQAQRKAITSKVYEGKVNKLSQELYSKYKPIALPREMLVSKSAPPPRIVLVNKPTTSTPGANKVARPVRAAPHQVNNSIRPPASVVIRSTVESQTRPPIPQVIQQNNARSSVSSKPAMVTLAEPVIRQDTAPLPVSQVSPPVVASTRKDVVHQFIANLKQNPPPPPAELPDFPLSSSQERFSSDESEVDVSELDAPVIEGIFFEDSDSEYQMVDDNVLKVSPGSSSQKQQQPEVSSQKSVRNLV